MFPRNVLAFRFDPISAAQWGDLEPLAAGRTLRECGGLEKMTIGFVPPFGEEGERLVRSLDRFELFAVGKEERILPAETVIREVNKRAKEQEKAQGRPLGGKERKQLKEAVYDQLLPKALTRRTKTVAWLDRKAGLLMIDAASRGTAEMVLSTLREVVGSIAAIPLSVTGSLGFRMTSWLAGQSMPAELSMGDSCELRSPDNRGEVWRGRKVDLHSREVGEHVHSGKSAYRLGLTFKDRVSFELGEDFTLRKFELLDLAQEQEGHDQETAEEATDALFFLGCSEATNAVAFLIDNFAEAEDDRSGDALDEAA